MKTTQTRRELLKGSVAAGAGVLLARHRGWAATPSASEILNVGIIGAAGMGKYSLDQVSADPHARIVALCDVHEPRVAEARQRFPKARFFNDYRKMIDAMGRDVDAVCVCTPDHHHAFATMAALRAGKHVYCEKPLTHTVWEARQVIEMARKQGLATQMGTQIHAGDNYRRVVELIQGGAIGEVREVHIWCVSVWSGGERPKETPPVPKGLHYDLWLGPAPYRPYHPAYLPVKWRGWWDFGGGGHADMACHFMDLPHWALGLRQPVAVEAVGPAVHPEHAPEKMNVRYEYPARGNKPPVKLTWYVGTNRPACFWEPGLPKWRDGVFFVGSKGKLLADYNKHLLLPENKFADFKRPDPSIPKSIGHHSEWIKACRTGSPTTCNFNYSGALAETVLLGNVAYRSGSRIEWDAANLKVTNAPEANRFIRREYRPGWSL